MNYLHTKILNSIQREQCRELWNREYPLVITHPDKTSFDAYLAQLEDVQHMLLLDESDEIKGWYFDFIRDNERWFALILDAICQGKGIGSKLLRRAQSRHAVLNAWVLESENYLKVGGDFYRPPMSFYMKNGFTVLEDQILETDDIRAVKIRWGRQK